jgi:hypothetical protein
MPVISSPIGGFAGQFFDNSGVILSGGKIYTYAAGTTTPQTTYTSVSGATPHSNPIVLDSAGRVPGGEIWLTNGVSYKFVIETSTGVLIGTYDNVADAAAFALVATTRFKLQAARTYYVRTDGSDSNTGLVDSAAGAFATWQAAIDAALAIDNGGFQVTIRAGAQSGVQTWNMVENQIRSITGKGSLLIKGNGANTVLNASGQCFSLYNTLSSVIIGSMELRSGSGYGTITVNNASVLEFDTVGPIFGTCGAFTNIWVHDNAAIAYMLNCSYTIASSPSLAHMFATNGGGVYEENCTVTISGARTTYAYAYANSGGYIQATLSTFAGTMTALRYSAVGGGIINTLANGINYFPGTTAGVVSIGGIYIDNGDTGFDNVQVTSINSQTVTTPGLYTPTITADAGAFAITPTAALSFSRINGVVTVIGSVSTVGAAVGTATGGILITPPVPIIGAGNVSASAVYNNVTQSLMPCSGNEGGNGKIRIVGNPTNNTFYFITHSYLA